MVNDKNISPNEVKVPKKVKYKNKYRLCTYFGTLNFVLCVCSSFAVYVSLNLFSFLLSFYKFQAPQKQTEICLKVNSSLSMYTMEFSPLVITFYVALLTMLPYCSSGEVNAQKSVTQYVHQSQGSLPLLPRKLKVQEESFAKSFAGENIEPHRKMEEAPSAGKEQENVMMQKKHGAAAGAGKGTWREWVDEEGPNRSEYFTMDYGWVRRRRPIHNKQIPYVP